MTRGEPVESISAVTLFTADMGAAVGFYRALGFPLLYGGPEAEFSSFRVGAGYLNLQLDRVGSARREPWGRVVFWVDDVDAMYRRARSGIHTRGCAGRCVVGRTVLPPP